MKPKVSVIMPTFMHRASIGTAIQSVLDQTIQDWELIIVNDGSADDTGNIVRAYTHDKRIRYFYQNNGGTSSARNLAISKAQGELIAYLDSDDFFLKDHLSVRIDHLEKNDCDFAFGPVRVVKENLTEIFHGELADSDTACVLPLMAMHRKICFDAGMFDEQYLYEEDLNLFLKMSHFYRVYQFSSPVTAVYNKHANSISKMYEAGGVNLVLQYINNNKRS